jgi:magnesium-transporting ATPase (P-type)
MFHEADISIEIGNNNVQGESDFILRDFEYLAHFIVVKGPFAFRKIEKILILYIFIHEILLFSRFFYEFFSSLSLNVLFSDKMFHFIGIGLMIISTAYFIFSPAPQYIEMLETFPLIYKSNALKINYSVMKFIFKSLIPSIVVAIGFLLDAIVYSNDLDEGNARSFPDVQSQLFICIVFVTYLQVFL